MKIFELVQTAKSPITQEVYIPSDSDIGISINIKDNETNLLPTSIFDENDNLIEEAGYIDAEMTIPYYKIHSKPEGSISKIKVEYTVDDESGKQVPMEFTVNINSTKSGFSYVAQVGGSGSEVTKEYVDTNLEKKQNVITDKNAGTNVTITTENGITKINATDTKPNVDKNYVDTELAKKQNILSQANEGENITITEYNGIKKINAVQPDLSDLQPKLTEANAGDNITIDNLYGITRISSTASNENIVSKSISVLAFQTSMFINLDRNHNYYNCDVTVDGNYDFGCEFGYGNELKEDEIANFQFKINLYVSNVKINWPDNLTWIGEAPDLALYNHILTKMTKVDNIIIAKVIHQWN